MSVRVRGEAERLTGVLAEVMRDICLGPLMARLNNRLWGGENFKFDINLDYTSGRMTGDRIGSQQGSEVILVSRN